MTPLTSAVFNTIIATIMIIPPTANIGALLDYMSFANWTIYALTFIAIILFRFIEPYKSIPRPFKIWLPLPIVCTGISIYLVIGPLIDSWSNSYLLAMVLIASGVIFYIPFVW